MASISGQVQDSQHISLTASNGKSIAITSAEVSDYLTNSVAEDIQTDAIAWVKNQIVAALGIDSISVSELYIEIDPSNGQFRSLEVI